MMTLSTPQRRFYKLVITCLLAFLFLAIPNPNHASPVTCARLKTNPDRWVSLKADALVRAARLAYESDDAIDFYQRVLKGINGPLKECKLLDDNSYTSRYQAFIDFVRVASLDSNPDHELGFLVTDEQYFKETKQFVEIPDFLLNKAFIKAVSRFETLDRAKAYLRQLNLLRTPPDQLVFFSYQSRHLGTPDNPESYGRLLVVVPGDPVKGLPDKWVQFGVADPGSRAHVRNVSVVSAVRGTDGTYEAYFKDFFRTYKRDGSITIEGRWELGEGDDNCVSCHKSGVLPIFPVAGTVTQAEQPALLSINERFRGYGSPRFGSYLDTKKLGPGLSSATADDRNQRFGRTFEQTAAARAMVCSSCHNSERLGSLNWPMDKVLISSYVRGGQMPFGQQLTAFDRRNLYAKLVEEYFSTNRDRPGVLMSWLLSKPESLLSTTPPDAVQYQK